MSEKFRKTGIGLVVLAIVVAVAFYAYYDRHIRYFQDTNDARIEADQVAISSKLAGYVQAVPVEENQTVAKDALLVRIDPLDFRTRLASADADIVSAQAAEAAARASVDESRAAISQAAAILDAARARLALAEREVKRYGPLVDAGAEPQARLSQLIAERDGAKADVAAHEAALAQARKRVSSLAAQARSLAAQGEVARVQRRAAANDLDSTSITAPIGGRVASRTVQAGQYVQPGQRLMTIVPAEGLYAVANFKETQVGLMRPGQPATIRVDALPGVEFKGQVTSISPGTGANFSLIKPENATGNFTKIVQRVPVRVRIEAGPMAQKILAPGLSIEVEVDTRASRDDIDTIREEQAGQ